MKIQKINDIIVRSGPERIVGLAGRVVQNGRIGVSAVLQIGERVFLENQQFDYFSEIASQKEVNRVKD